MNGDKEKYLLIKVGSLNNSPISIKNSVTAASRHNCREFDEPNSDIDTSLTQLNYSILGLPATSAGILALKSSTQKALGYKQARKNDSVAVEVVLSLKDRPTEFSERQYFEGGAKFVEKWYRGTLISAVVHLDQGHPHCHVLILLDVGEGKPSGTEQIGKLADHGRLARAFEAEYSERFGVTLPPPALKGPAKKAAARQVHQHMQATGNTMIGAPGWALVSAWIAERPAQMARELGLSLTPGTSLRQLAASTGKGPRTESAQAASDRRIQQRQRVPTALHLVAPQDAAEPTKTDMAVVAVDAAPISAAMEAPTHKHPSCVAVFVAAHLPPCSEALVSSAGAGAESPRNAAARPSLPQQFSRERDDDIPAEFFNVQTGEPMRPPAATARGGKSAAKAWVASQLATVGIGQATSAAAVREAA